MPIPRARARFWIAALSLAAGTGTSHAAGLGPIDVQSALGQSFRASVALIGNDTKEQGAGCVKARLESLDGVLSIAAVISVVRTDQTASIRLSTRESINEPALNIQVSLGCEVSVQRSYQVLLDPVSMLPTVPRPAPVPAATAPSRSQTIATPAGPEADDAKSTTRPNRSRNNRQQAAPEPAGAPLLAADTLPATRPAPKPAPKPVAKPRPVERSVLRMSPVDEPLDDASITLKLKFSDSLTVPAGGAALKPGAVAGTTANATDNPQDPAAMAARTEELVKASQALALKALQAEADALRIENAKIRLQAPSDKLAINSMRDELLTWVTSLGLIILLCLIAIGWLIWRFQAIRKSQYQASWNELFPEAGKGESKDADTTFGNTTFNTTELVTAQIIDTEELPALTTDDRLRAADIAALAHEAAVAPPARPRIMPTALRAPMTAPVAEAIAAPLRESVRAPEREALVPPIAEPAVAPDLAPFLAPTPKPTAPEVAEVRPELAAFEYSHAGSAPFLFNNRTEHAIGAGDTIAPRPEAVKAEEISDVMELVDAWMALHEPAKVLELLEPFNHVDRPESPLPWLCLLDVYRSLDDQEKYEAILHRITMLFNVKLASWESRLLIASPRTLADYPHVVENILAKWDSDDIVPYLESLLLDNRDGARDGFDLPVYRDIARLNSLARNPSRPRKVDELRQLNAYAMLFAESTPEASHDPVAAPLKTTPKKPATEAPAKPLLRERPRYITTSYQRGVTGKDGIADQAPAAGKVKTADVAQAAMNEPEIKKASFFVPRTETAPKTRKSVSAKPALNPQQSNGAVPIEVASAERSAANGARGVTQGSGGEQQMDALRPAAQSLPEFEMIKIPGAASTPAPTIAGLSEDMSPMTIKLHLAIAYQDIGDIEGACLLLDEVIRDGTPDQSKQAKLLLSALG